METNFHVDHARKTCVVSCLNLQTGSQKYEKSRYFLVKMVMFFIIVVIDH